ERRARGCDRRCATRVVAVAGWNRWRLRRRESAQQKQEGEKEEGGFHGLLPPLVAGSVLGRTTARVLDRCLSAVVLRGASHDALLALGLLLHGRLGRCRDFGC